MEIVSMDLITKIVILATALVGLYKAATFARSRNGSAESTHAGESRPRPLSSFSALFELVGVLLFMLAFPAFIWMFTWITSNISERSSNRSQTSESGHVVLSEKPSPAELAYVAATNIPNTTARTAALIQVVTFAIDAKEFKMAILAASAIPNTIQKGEQLQRVVDAIQQRESPNKKASN